MARSKDCGIGREQVDVERHDLVQVVDAGGWGSKGGVDVVVDVDGPAQQELSSHPRPPAGWRSQASPAAAIA